MKRKDYQKPTMKVVQLKHRAQLLQASGQVQATMDGVFTEEELAPQLQLPGDLLGPDILLPE